MAHIAIAIIAIRIAFLPGGVAHSNHLDSHQAGDGFVVMLVHWMQNKSLEAASS